MSDILLKCPECESHFAVDQQAVDRDFVCTLCGLTVHIARPAVFFQCPSCKEGLFAATNIIGEAFDCSQCQESLTVPDTSCVLCKRCSSKLTLDEATYKVFAGHTTGCPKCGKAVEIPLMPTAITLPDKGTCPNCSANVSTDEVICVNCGTNLETGQRLMTLMAPSEEVAEIETVRQLRCHQCGHLSSITDQEYSQAQSERTSFGCPGCGAELMIAPLQ